MPIKVRSAGTVSIIDVSGKIDINSSKIIEVVGWLINNRKREILLNLREVNMVDYSGLSILAIAYKNVVNHKGKIKLVNVPLPVQELLRMVRLDAVFEVYNDESAAIKSFLKRTKIDALRLRRKYHRLSVHLKIKYKLMGRRKKPAVFAGSATDVSAAGVFIFTPDTFSVNTPLQVKMKLPGETKSFAVASKVIWVADKELQPHAYPGMGVAFSKVNPKLEKKIVSFVEKNISTRPG